MHVAPVSETSTSRSAAALLGSLNPETLMCDTDSLVFSGVGSIPGDGGVGAIHAPY